MTFLKKLLFVAGLLALAAGPALAYEEGTWIFRGGVGSVAPKSDNYSESVETDAGLASVEIDVDNGTSLTLMATYMFTENWAVDVLGSLPFNHDIDVTLGLDGETVTAPLAETKHLPPTVSIQYHFAPDATFQPYVGAGVNWTTFFSTDLDSDTVAFLDEQGILGLEDLELDDSFGLALQIGGDWQINDKWILNIDVRYVDIETDATLTIVDNSVEPPERAKGEIGTVEIDPWVYSINVGFKF